eukprot:8078769-Pyramimonas_sp.AAC.1
MSKGRAHGLRIPSPEERARAVGLGGCYASLGIMGRRLFDAVDIRFDPRCLQRRIVSVILAWNRGDPLPGPQLSAPDE